MLAGINDENLLDTGVSVQSQVTKVFKEKLPT